MAIMDRVRSVTATEEPSTLDAATVWCSDCGQVGGVGIAPMSWGYSRHGGRIGRTCPECVRASLDEIETFITR